MYYIIAGNFQQATNWADSNKLKRVDWKYVSGPQYMAGIDPETCDLVFVGTWKENSQDIYDYLSTHPRWWQRMKSIMEKT